MSPASNTPSMRYATIVVDPPWEYDGFASDPTSGRGLSEAQREPIKAEPMPYASMSLAEIRGLPLPELAAPNCRLFLWTTNRYIEHSFAILAGWGFTYRQTLVWHKTGNPSPFGGSVAPNHAEFLLVATRGKPELGGRHTSSVITAPAQRRHSRKPEAFLDVIETVSSGPYLEMFARRNRFGWDTWGNEALEHVAMTA